jgi:hypothetical protein
MYQKVILLKHTRLDARDTTNTPREEQNIPPIARLLSSFQSREPVFPRTILTMPTSPSDMHSAMIVHEVDGENIEQGGHVRF